MPSRIDYVLGMTDEIIATEVKTQSMSADPRLVQAFGNAGEVKIKTLDFKDQAMEAMGDGGQYPLGSVKVTWASYTLANDEGKAFDVPWTESTKGGLSDDSAMLVSEYTRQQVVPRIDKVRLTKLGTTGYVASIRGKEAAAPTAANIYSEICAGLKALGNDYGSDEGNTIYLPYTYADLLDRSSELTNTRDVKNASRAIVGRVDEIDGNPIVRIPDSYLDGYAFAMHAPGTVNGISVVRIKQVAPENNTRGDGAFLGFHVYHDAIILGNKAAGTYAYHIQAAREPEPVQTASRTTSKK